MKHAYTYVCTWLCELLVYIHMYYEDTLCFSSLFHKADQSGDNALSFDEFEQSLKEMDNNLTRLPPTAQVSCHTIF